jgi:hypothetical protein
MTTLLFVNDASTTLQSGLTTVATSCTVAAGTGSLFPSPTAGQAFYLTFLDAATQQIKEIVLCTSRTGDVLQIQRSQQGTLALTWNAGDLVVQLVTAGDMANNLQPDELQSAGYTVCNGSGTNSITATLASGLTALPPVLQFTVIAAAANTGNVTLTLTLGLTPQAAAPVLKFGGSQLNPGDIPEAGFPVELTWVHALGCYVMTNPATSSAGSIAGGAANELLVQTAPGSTGFIGAPTTDGSVLTRVGGVIEWANAAVTSFNGRSGAVFPEPGDYSAAMVGAIAAALFNSPNQLIANPGFVTIPNTGGGPSLIVQWGSRAISPNTDTYPSFPKIFPNQCSAVVVSCNNQAAAINVDNYTVSNFHTRVNATLISWIAFGF